MNKAGVCLLFDYHAEDAFTRFNCERFRDAAAGLVDYFPVRHVISADSNGLQGAIAGAVDLTDPDIFERLAHEKDYRGAVVPGNRDLKILAACELLPGYRHYISVEYDVIFLGRPREALALLIETAMAGDFGASRIAPKQEYNRDWIWWPGLRAPRSSGIDMEAISTSAFLPIVSFSSDFAAACEKRLADGWVGHYEALLPTLARFCGAPVADFNQTEPKLTAFDQFDVRPLETLSLDHSIFAHPIKSIPQFERLIGAL